MEGNEKYSRGNNHRQQVLARVGDTKVGVLAEYYSIEEGTAHTDKLLCIVALNYDTNGGAEECLPPSVAEGPIVFINYFNEIKLSVIAAVISPFRLCYCISSRQSVRCFTPSLVLFRFDSDERQNPSKKRKFMISPVQTLHRIRVEIGFHG